MEMGKEEDLDAGEWEVERDGKIDEHVDEETVDDYVTKVS